MIDRQVGRESDLLHASFPFLRCDQDNTVGCLRTVKSGSGSTFQDTHAFDIVRVEVGNTIATITVTGICRTTDCADSLFVTAIQHRYTIDYI